MSTYPKKIEYKVQSTFSQNPRVQPFFEYEYNVLEYNVCTRLYAGFEALKFIETRISRSPHNYQPPQKMTFSFCRFPPL